MIGENHMKIRPTRSITDRLRPVLSKKYLDWAEILPRFRGGTIGYLQDIREYDRKQSDDACTRTKPAKDTEFAFESLVLFEMFQAEEYRQIHSSLVKLFPMLEGLFGNSSLKDIERMAEQGLEGGWHIIGVVGRKEYTGANLIRLIDPKLPNEVLRIEIWLQKILPSTFVLGFEAKLSEGFSKELRQLQRNHFIPEVLFDKLVPWKLHRSGYSSFHSEQIQEREILCRITQLQREIENYLKPHFSGFFFDLDRSNRRRLPSLELFTIKGAPSDPNEWKTWEEAYRPWCGSLGFEFFLSAYGDEKLMLTFPDRMESGSEFAKSALRLTVFKDAFLDTINSRDPGIIDLAFYLRQDIREIVPHYILQEFLSESENLVRSFRSKATKKMKGWSLLKTHFRLSEELHYFVMLFDSITQEFEQMQKWTAQSKGRISVLQATWKTGAETQSSHSVEQHMLNGLSFRVSRLRQQVSYLKSVHSDYLSIRNTLAIYRLQATAAYGAILAIVAAILIAILS